MITNPDPDPDEPELEPALQKKFPNFISNPEPGTRLENKKIPDFSLFYI